MHANTILAIAVLVVLFAAGMWDVYAYYSLPTGSTVSEVLGDWFRNMPILAVFTGVILGHLAWPQKGPPIPPAGP